MSLLMVSWMDTGVNCQVRFPFHFRSSIGQCEIALRIFTKHFQFLNLTCCRTVTGARVWTPVHVPSFVQSVLECTGAKELTSQPIKTTLVKLLWLGSDFLTVKSKGLCPFHLTICHIWCCWWPYFLRFSLLLLSGWYAFLVLVICLPFLYPL